MSILALIAVLLVAAAAFAGHLSGKKLDRELNTRPEVNLFQGLEVCRTCGAQPDKPCLIREDLDLPIGELKVPHANRASYASLLDA